MTIAMIIITLPLIMMTMMMIVVRQDKRMTNSPLAVGTNGKFTESATFHNSARRQLSTNPGQRLKRNSTERERMRERESEETPTGPPSATIFTLSNTFPATPRCCCRGRCLIVFLFLLVSFLKSQTHSEDNKNKEPETKDRKKKL